MRFAVLDRISTAAPAALWVFLSALCAAGAPAAASELFNLPDFAFEDGSVLPDLRIAYDTRGTLSPARDNAILLMPGATGDRHTFDPLIGPGKMFDTDRYFVISVDPVSGTIALDPEWQGGRYTHNPVEGLRHAGMLMYPWVVSTAYLDRSSPRVLAKDLDESAKTFGAWDANALVLRFAAYRAHDVAAPFDGDMRTALAKVTAPTLL